MKWLLTIVGILSLAAALAFGFIGHLYVMSCAFAGFIALLLSANLDRISEFKASRSGFEAKTREVIARAESTLSEVQLLARIVGELTLSLVKRSGKIGGYDDDEQQDIKSKVLSSLKKIGIDNSEFPHILQEWYIFTEIDYVHAILGGSIVPEKVGESVISEWKELKRRRSVTPAEIKSFFDKNIPMTDETKEYINDYEYYCINREHRRPDVWKRRHSWGRLTLNGRGTSYS